VLTANVSLFVHRISRLISVVESCRVSRRGDIQNTSALPVVAEVTKADEAKAGCLSSHPHLLMWCASQLVESYSLRTWVDTGLTADRDSPSLCLPYPLTVTPVESHVQSW